MSIHRGASFVLNVGKGLTEGNTKEIELKKYLREL